MHIGTRHLECAPDSGRKALWSVPERTGILYVDGEKDNACKTTLSQTFGVRVRSEPTYGPSGNFVSTERCSDGAICARKKKHTTWVRTQRGTEASDELVEEA